MEERIAYVDRVLGFRFKHSFARRFAEVGSPLGDLDVWHKNAQVYQSVTDARPPREADRNALLTLIEAVRFEAMCPPPPGGTIEFDVSAYQFSEDILSYKAEVVGVVLRQEAASPSVLDV